MGKYKGNRGTETVLTVRVRRRVEERRDEPEVI
jgi:hypothetical protein